jgi:hypothetical protein
VDKKYSIVQKKTSTLSQPMHILATSKTKKRSLSMVNTTPDFSGIQVKWSDIRAVSNYFDIFLNDYPISAEVKWCVAQLQLPALILYAQDATILENSNSAFRLLLKSVLAVEKYVSRYADAQKMTVQGTPVIAYAKDIIEEAKNSPYLERWLSLSSELADFLQRADQTLMPKVTTVLEMPDHRYEQKYKEAPEGSETKSERFSSTMLDPSHQDTEAKTYRDLEVFAYTKKLLAQERGVHTTKSEPGKNTTQEMSAVEKQQFREHTQLQSYIAQVELMKVGMRLMYHAGRQSTRVRLLRKLDDKIVFAEDKSHTVIEKTFNEVALDLKRGVLRIIRVPFLS